MSVPGRSGTSTLGVVTLRAVLFDFSGTLFRLEEDPSWYADLTDADGAPFDLAAQAEIMRRMTAPTGQIVQLDAEYQHAWDNRDLDPELHRKVYVEVLRSSGVQDGEADGLYERLIDPDYWTEYPDTAEVLRRLHTSGVKVGVISNIAFDIRPAFERIGVTQYVDEFLLSYLEGVIKPDPKIFLRACERLGVEPSEALMVGDSEEADGGAAAVGCQVAIVEPTPTAQRRDALLTAAGDLLR
ncbi:haloacid dehalogenase superfamily, subfamily IA, variant 3 with third motif having DD or ED/haloacid dehalogenase superfamily, subfamily IA, variant 1 with third motif having Dx(3-4)D or Dx(3-4)E [Saccharopolyspora kobensis]|uniref:Haloacid dehalogenase superfamily, subfamily IA, variant 3 with third motif having DD or ED/haloacid dehalogenase superfamily, subfamily IA, variant 1 with third motif having Dx(3-4)D or Dx(3-4)E n=1 Tax=Saccharopolyspora kobensis TaxID=146035 RepID=A0A1H6EL41_9PSEU|nr:haloacid dehalogenase superfamily, subfamily IA, variant 3 with third motif having DD or ED/haloacid dehalogenase superfamily, subfamily IA, variant 1 with third motif having Dx(3-4)D or Dx(3-4)E [Saccharopolyspora kobensis]SFE93951.1 haloacid dehalogenase superfamily, subfamily IA, variant 3 with third motif having DD or ED/haloacid dehalogenase superfamily, subfamily IA, variant 1 with third motif having Dx(3-4)D or Dx(3-4)E [Saccharopolyspora kobensis]